MAGAEKLNCFSTVCLRTYYSSVLSHPIPFPISDRQSRQDYGDRSGDVQEAARPGAGEGGWDCTKCDPTVGGTFQLQLSSDHSVPFPRLFPSSFQWLKSNRLARCPFRLVITFNAEHCIQPCTHNRMTACNVGALVRGVKQGGGVPFQHFIFVLLCASPPPRRVTTWACWCEASRGRTCREGR